MGSYVGSPRTATGQNLLLVRTIFLTAVYMKSPLSSEKDAAIRDAHARGLTIIDTIKMIRERYQMSLGEAKNLVSNTVSGETWCELLIHSKMILKNLSENERLLPARSGLQ